MPGRFGILAVESEALAHAQTEVLVLQRVHSPIRCCLASAQCADSKRCVPFPSRRRVARKFVRALKSGNAAELEEYRYYPRTLKRHRVSDFLTLFDDVLDAAFPDAAAQAHTP